MKTVLITGASSGIGADTAREVASRGNRVILLARSEPALRELADEIGDRASIAVCDATDGNAVLEMADKLRADMSVPDVIINCAGMGAWKRIEDTPPEEGLAMIKAPYLAAFNTTHAFMRDMLKRGSGTLIHINSPACFFPWPASLGYAASRWALRGLHESLRQDLAGTGVRSCHVVFSKVDSPYFVRNDGAADNLPGIAKTIRTLSSKECGRVIANVVDRPRTQVVHPFMLKLYYYNHLVFPASTRFLLRVTGAKRDRA